MTVATFTPIRYFGEYGVVAEEPRPGPNRRAQWPVACARVRACVSARVCALRHSSLFVLQFTNVYLEANWDPVGARFSVRDALLRPTHRGLGLLPGPGAIVYLTDSLC